MIERKAKRPVVKRTTNPPKRNMDARDGQGKTTLITLAGVSDNVETVRRLLDSKADMEAKDVQDKTALGYALDKGHAKVAGLLLERGAALADIEAKDEQDKTVLVRELGKGHTQVAGLLLERGAALEAGTEAAKQAAVLALKDGSTSMIKSLLRRGITLESVLKNPECNEASAHLIKTMLTQLQQVEVAVSAAASNLPRALARMVREYLPLLDLNGLGKQAPASAAPIRAPQGGPGSSLLPKKQDPNEDARGNPFPLVPVSSSSLSFLAAPSPRRRNQEPPQNRPDVASVAMSSGRATL